MTAPIQEMTPTEEPALTPTEERALEDLTIEELLENLDEDSLLNCHHPMAENA